MSKIEILKCFVKKGCLLTKYLFTYHQDLWDKSAHLNNFFWTLRNSIFQKLYLEVDFLVVEYIIGRFVGIRNVFVKFGIGVEAV